MNTINNSTTIGNININVSYNEVKPSKLIDALEKYNAAVRFKNVVDDEATPIINAVAEKKVEMIIKQLSPVLDVCKIIRDRSNSCLIRVSLRHIGDCDYDYITLSVRSTYDSSAYSAERNVFVGCDNIPLSKSSLICPNSIVSHWEEWGIYNTIEKEVINKLERITKQEIDKAKWKQDTLKDFLNHN